MPFTQTLFIRTSNGRTRVTWGHLGGGESCAPQGHMWQSARMLPWWVGGGRQYVSGRSLMGSGHLPTQSKPMALLGFACREHVGSRAGHQLQPRLGLPDCDFG